MRYAALTGVAGFILCICSGTLLAQARFSGVGDLSGGNIWSEVYGVSGNGHSVIGKSQGETKTLPFIWSEAGGLAPFGSDVVKDGQWGSADAISHDGGVTVGTYHKFLYIQMYSIYADIPFQYSGGSLSPVHPQPDSPWVQHAATAVSGDGSTIVGSYDVPDDGLQSLPCVFRGGRQMLPLPADMNRGVAKGASFNGSIIAGEATSATNTSYPNWAFVWENGIYRELARDAPGFPISVTGVSADGSTVIGSTASGSSGNRRAARWRINGTGGTGIQSPGASANGVSADGEVVVGETMYISSLARTAAFVWDEVRGVQLVEDVLQKQFGINLGGWKLLKATGVSADGSVIVGIGRNPSSWTEGWYAYIPYLFVRGIYSGQVFRPGEKDTLTWKYSGPTSLNIYLSLDSGKTRRPLVENHPAISGRYIWTIPDAISNECQVIVEDAGDPRVKYAGPLFTIRGKFLIRDHPQFNGKWELFDPAVHGWKFANTDGYLWPMSWWNQFSYVVGIDPYTNARYPSRAPFHYASDNTFPDWPLFVRTFGEGSCYYITPLGKYYRGSAEQFWDAIRGKWGGSCYGFAYSTLLAFSHPAGFRTAFPEMPGYNGVNLSYRLSEFDTTANIRKVINSLMISQEGKPHKSYYIYKSATTTPKQTLAEFESFLGSTTGYRRSLSLVPQNDNGGHEVVGYRVSPDPGGPSVFRIYVNDSNLPGRGDLWVTVDTVANTWVYSHLTNDLGAAWSGSMGLTLDDPAILYEDPPTFFKAGEGSDEQQAAFLAAAQTYDLYIPRSGDILISDAAGRSLGHAGDSLLRQIPEGAAMKPPGINAPPPGFTVPKGEYTIIASNSPDSTMLFKVFSDSLLYSYRRSGVRVTETDDLRIHAGGINVRNRDATVKRFAIESVVPFIGAVGERQFVIKNLTLGEGDSLRVAYPFVSDDIILANYGSRSIAYDLDLIYVQRQTSTSWNTQKFTRSAISLQARSTHKLDPSWTSMQGQALHIAVDTANTGSYNVDLYLTNQMTDVEEHGSPGEQPTEFGLFQNYPNPFNPATTIRFGLRTASEVRLSVFDLLGREVVVLVNEVRDAGIHEVTFDGSGLSSGVYYCRLTAGELVQTRKLVLQK